MNKFVKIIFISFSIILGILMGITMKNYVINLELPAMGDRDILILWKDFEREVNDLENRVTNLKTQIKKLETEQYLDKDIINLKQIRDELKKDVGWETINGPGLIITLDDSQIRLREGDDPSFYIIHESYLRYLINILKEGQAKGIAINSERIQLSSNISCVGKIILINGKRVAPPYEISAVGNPEMMMKTLKEAPFFKFLDDYRSLFGIQINIRVSNYLELPLGNLVMDLNLFEVEP